MKTAAVLEVQEAKAVIEELRQTGNDLVADLCNVMAVALLRVGDAVNLRYSDIQRGVLFINEQKTGKPKELPLPSSILEMIATRRAAFPKDEYIFCAKGNRAAGNKPVSRVYVSRCIASVAKGLGIEGTISAHSFRKYGAAAVYTNNGNDLAQAAALLNHSSFDSTRRYLKLDVQSAGVAVRGIATF